VTEFASAAAQGFWVAAEDERQVGEAAPSEFEGFGGGIQTPFAFAERTKDVSHRGFDFGGVPWCHDDLLPVEWSCPPNLRRLPETQRAKKAKPGS